MLYHMPFQTADALIVNTNQHVTVHMWPVKQQWYVYLHNFMIAQ